MRFRADILRAIGRGVHIAPGGYAKLARRLPFPRLWGWLSREFRMAFEQRKHDIDV
jgi:hypothetical protein